LTKGERGKHPELRVPEFVRAMSWWGFEYQILDFPDLGLAIYPLGKVVKKIGQIVNKLGISQLISFSPFELTIGFDHPDHNRAGEVTRLVSTAMTGSRGLWLWTSQGKLSLTNERVQYVKRFYPSQNISKKILAQIGESYLKIR